MIQQIARIESNREIAEGLFLLRFESESIAPRALPGQFVNIRTVQGWSPLLLRRPFSISRIVGTSVELLFNIVGNGTRALASKRPGDELDVLGPLGQPFRLDGSYGTAVIVAGGLGVAPFPFLTDALDARKKVVVTFVGSRGKFAVDKLHLRNVHYATDDGSRGYRGTVVECLADYVRTRTITTPKIFGCGPNRMLAALSEFSSSQNMPCEISLEGDMACGVGICQGCPVERTHGDRKYALVCKDGPTFDCEEVRLMP